ncbi:MAG: 16S rRNA (guanine(966)-N(2))-methyltransferase RsmD [Candidatus Sericytochromatia bacterium]|nr:16S rRNA (guanine(966)-N(2))-methyltransferase RsmD [Candidatus Sericytochromatia bacterium]
MIRIAGGKWRGRALEVPPGEATRPTGARVREAVGSILGSVLPGARVLDLFAGSGALGLECLSRGAANLMAVERHGPTAALVARNAGRLGATGQVRVASAEVLAWLAADVGTYDVVLADPPYAWADWERLRQALAPRLGSTAVVLLERPSDAPMTAWPGFRLAKVYRYGGTRLERWVRDSFEGESPPAGTTTE